MLSSASDRRPVIGADIILTCWVTEATQMLKSLVAPRRIVVSIVVGRRVLVAYMYNLATFLPWLGAAVVQRR
jgi:hypothetical protein